MKLLSVFRKAMTIQIRDYWALLITVLIGPFFVLIYWLITSGASTTFTAAVLNKDQSIPSQNFEGGKELIKTIGEFKYENGSPIVKLKLINALDEGKQSLQNRDIDLLLEIPENFSKTILAKDSIKPGVKFYGDISNPRYSVAAIMMFTGVDGFIRGLTGAVNAVDFKEEFIGGSIKRTEFELSVPGLIVLSLVMLLFTAGMIFIRDIEDKTLNRLKITRMTVFDYVGGITLTQAIVGILSVALTFMTAWMMGFRNEGSIGAALLVSSLTFLSVLGITLIVVSLCKNSVIFLTAGNIPLFVLMFLSGAMIPIPRTPLFTIGDRIVAWNDFLSPTHATIALNKVVSLGGGLKDVLYEITVLIILTVIYFTIGIYLFKKQHFAEKKV